MVKFIKRWFGRRKSRRLWKQLGHQPLSEGPGLKIVAPYHGRGQLWFDGKKVPQVRSVKINLSADELNTAIIEVVPDTIELEGTFDVTTIESDARELRTNPLPAPCD